MESAFLNDILGKEGSKALTRTLELAPFLESVVTPRSVLAWVSTVGNMGYEGELPGTPNSYFSLIKNDNKSYSGALTIDNQLYTFEDADMLHVAASVGVSLGIKVDPIDENLKKKDLSQLGNSIDLLVKSEIVRKLKLQPKFEKPLIKESTRTNNLFKKELKSAPTVKLKITKSESISPCEECGYLQFKGDKLVGCKCLEDLSKSISVDCLDNGYLLKFDPELDEDAITTVISIFKGD